MKQEKRDITLNEKDSLTDMLVFEKYLLSLYEKYIKETDVKELQEIFSNAIRILNEDILKLDEKTSK